MLTQIIKDDQGQTWVEHYDEGYTSSALVVDGNVTRATVMAREAVRSAMLKDALKRFGCTPFFGTGFAH